MIAERERPHCLIIYSYVQSLQRRLSELEGRSTTNLDGPAQSEAVEIADVGNVVSEGHPSQLQAPITNDATVQSPPDDYTGHHHSAEVQPIQIGCDSNLEPSRSPYANASPLSSHDSHPQAQSRHGRGTSSAYSPPEPVNPSDLPNDLEHLIYQSTIKPEALPARVEEHLIEVYFTHANRKYPFLLQSTFCSWYRNWKTGTLDEASPDLWQGFMVHMV